MESATEKIKENTSSGMWVVCVKIVMMPSGVISVALVMVRGSSLSSSEDDEELSESWGCILY